MKYSSIIFISFLIFGISAIFIWFWQKRLREKDILDHPNHRSSHIVPTPRAGGVGIFLSFFVGIIVLWAYTHEFELRDLFLFSGAFLIFLVGLWDDFYEAKRRVRLLIQFLSASFIYLWLYDSYHDWVNQYTQNPFLEEGVAFVWIVGLVWAINLFNFMDGINGIAGMQTVFLSTSLAVLLAMNNRDENRILQMVLLATATLGFLIWNFPRAKVFMGDCGSGFIGFFLAALGSWAFFSDSVGIWTILLLGILFWLDASLTLFLRIFKREKIFNAHSDHAYQILSRKLGSHATVTIFYCILNVFLIFPFAYFMQQNENIAFYVFLIFLLLFGFLYFQIVNIKKRKNVS